MSIKSHLLKHAVDLHHSEDMTKLQFGLKVLKYTRSAFERQIYESVSIEENRYHHLLNSRSEFNRSAVPRLTCKLGDKSYKKYEQEIEKDMEKEEGQVSKIRELIKERNKNRAQKQRKPPPPKRRKMEEGTYEPRQENQQEKPAPEKETREVGRPQDQQEEAPPSKRQNRNNVQDIREAMEKARNTEKPSTEPGPRPEEGQGQGEETRPGQEEQEVGAQSLTNWEEIFRQHLEETRRMNKEREEKI